MPPEDEEKDFQTVLEVLRRARGFDGRSYKPNYLKRRVAIRMRATGSLDYAAYLRVLRTDPREIPLLVDRLTVHVTEFFRDSEVYDAVERQAFPFLEADFPGKIWNIWSAGCSSGEEPYSLAIALKEWRVTHPEGDFLVKATDIDPDSVSAAERGLYPMESLAKLPDARRARWFLTSGRQVEVAPEIRRRIRFEVRDLMGAWERPERSFHLIFCRNLLIYLTADEHQTLYERFARALHPGGFLILGRTEALLGRGRVFFKCVDARNRLYRRVD